MKKIALTLTAAFITVFATFANNGIGGAPKVTTNFGLFGSQVSDYIQLTIDNAALETVDVRIEDVDGNLIYSERITDKSFIKKKYSGLDAGVYEVIFSIGDLKEKQTVYVGVAPEATIAFESSILPVTDKATTISFKGGTDLTLVKLFDSKGELVYTKLHYGNEYKKVKYDLSELNAGKYTLQVNNGDDTKELAFEL